LKLSLWFIMVTTWIFVIGGCTPILDANGCWGYTYDPGLKRGTLLKNQNYVSPYRQCVDENYPHQDLDRRSNG